MWWEELQPPARKVAGTLPGDIPLEQWSRLRVSGKHGLYLILSGLVWWGLDLVQAHLTPESVPEWQSMVDDVRSVVERWLDSPNMAGGSKRKQSSENPAASKRQRT